MKEELEKLMKEEFFDIGEIARSLPGICYIPTTQKVELINLPYTIKEWPIYERKSFSGGSLSRL